MLDYTWLTKCCIMYSIKRNVLCTPTCIIYILHTYVYVYLILRFRIDC